MKQVLSDQLRRDLRKLLDEIERDGEHVEVGRWDRPVAVLVPVVWHEKAEGALAVLDRLAFLADNWDAHAAAGVLSGTPEAILARCARELREALAAIGEGEQS